ncbi:MAG: ABC transporter ATP-binding protein [Thermoproteota archaeon]
MNAIETQNLTRVFVRYNYVGTQVSMDREDNPGGLFLSLYNRYFNKNVKKETLYAVNEVNIKVKKGQLVCILGPNGCGKTTLLRILATLLQPTQGTAYIMGHDVVKEEKVIWRYVTYVAGLLTGGAWMDPRLTPRDILTIQARLYGFPEERIRDALELSRLIDVANVRVSTFSTGMLARLSVAIGLLRDSPVYLLDEPMVGISKDVTEELYSYMKNDIQKRMGATFLYATNNVFEAQRLADEIIMMYGGKVIAQGKIDELITKFFKEQVIEIEISNCSFDILKSIDSLPKVSKIINLTSKNELDTTLAIYTAFPREILPILIREILEKNGEIRYIKVREPTLEEVFIKVMKEKSKEGEVAS